ncbi:MAG: hypothetical protein M1826_003634 [Phylliscum demangeonii]|nr:MAG: hypothetical protein M1826_003634 [Phylliscum demangeonii]
MRAPAFLFLSSLLMVDVWAAPPRQRTTKEPSSTGPSTDVAPAVSLEPPADAAPLPHTLSSLGRRSLPAIDILGIFDPGLRRLTQDHPRFAQSVTDYQIHAITQKYKVEARMEDENFSQCMLRRLNVPKPRPHRELPVADLDLFRSAFLCQIETGDFDFKFPHVKRFLLGRANEPVGYREEDLAKAAESIRFRAADTAPPSHNTLSSLDLRSPAKIDVSGIFDDGLRRLARDHPQFAQPVRDYQIHAITQKYKVEARMEDENFSQCMLRRLNLPMRPPHHWELPVGDLDLFRSAFFCQIETGDFDFKFPHVKRFLPGRANEPVGYRERDLAQAAASMRFHVHVPAPLARLYSGFQKDFQLDVRSLARPLGRALLSWERAAPKRMTPTAAESWRFTSEPP